MQTWRLEFPLLDGYGGAFVGVCARVVITGVVLNMKIISAHSANRLFRNAAPSRRALKQEAFDKFLRHFLLQADAAGLFPRLF